MVSGVSLTFTRTYVTTPQQGGGSFPYGDETNLVATDGGGNIVAFYPYYEGCDIWRSTNGGQTWAYITTLSNSAYNYDFGSCAGYIGGKLFIGGVQSGGGLIAYSTDGGQTWPGTFSDGSVSDGFLAFATDGNGNGVFGNERGQEAGYTTDGLTTLQTASNYANASAFLWYAYPGELIWDGTNFVAYGYYPTYGFFTAPPSGLVTSGGFNWTPNGSPSSSEPFGPYFDTVHPFDYNSVFSVYVHIGTVSSSPYIWLASTPGALLTATPVALPSGSGSGRGAWCPNDGLGTIFASDTNGNFWASSDGGSTWTAIATDFLTSGEPVDDLIYDPTSSSYILIGSLGSISVAVGSVTVPNVLGDTLADGESAIVAAGCTVGTVGSAYSSTYPSGEISAQSPAGGATVAPGTAVDLTESLGPPPASISISPTSVTVPLGGTTDFTYATVNPTGESATWSCEHGTISNGVYTAPALPSRFSGDIVTVTRDDDGLYAEAVVTWEIPTNPPTPGNPSGVLAGGYRSPNAYPPVMLVNVPSINPKIYAPVQNTTVIAQ
jgi:PASTA domain